MNIQSTVTRAASIKQPMDYRPDIDGLRAVSVISVVLYHYGIWPITGGFVGVDVFFVISGYLITSHLWKDIGRGEFSLLKFYDRRFRRILPALFVVLLVTLVAGYWFMLPGDYDSLGRQVAYSAFGFSNFFFLWNTGYFDQEADLLPLLHTWSLAVEEQFYLFWPLLLAGFAMLVKRSRLAVLCLVLAIIAASLAASVWTVNREPSTAFYMLHTRAWELAAGALLVFVPRIGSRMLGEAANIIGLALIIYTVLTITSDVPFPGLAALPPVLGAALVIWPKADTYSAKVLGVEPMRQIGLASYSLYLWHWPVLVFFRHYANSMPNPFETVILVGASVLLAFVSLRWVETPARRYRVHRNAIATGLLAMGLVAIPGHVISSYEGFPTRIPSSISSMRSLDEMWNWECPQIEQFEELGRACTFGGPWDESQHRILLWGDSHASHFVPILQAALRGREGTSVILFHGCAAAYGGNVHRMDSSVGRSKEKCTTFYNSALKFIGTRDPTMIILAAAWSGKLTQLYTDKYKKITEKEGAPLFNKALTELVSAVGSPTRTVVIVSNFPNWGNRNPVPCAIASVSPPLRRPCAPRDRFISMESYKKSNGVIDQIINDVANKATYRTRTIFPGVSLCTAQKCENTLEGEFIYRDSGHLRRNLQEKTLRHISKLIGLDALLQEDMAE